MTTRIMLAATIALALAAPGALATPPRSAAVAVPKPAPATPAKAGDASAPPAAAADATAAAAPDQAANDSTLAATVESGRGPAVLRAQILLNRANFSVGEIDGAYGSNVRRAINGFQERNGLPVTGKVDAPTWAALNTDTAPVLASFTLSAEDVAGPFVKAPSDMMEKAKLKALGYASALEAVAEKFHASPALLQQLNPGKDFGKAGEQIVAPNVIGRAPLPQAAKVVVDKSDSTVALLDAGGRVFAQFPATTGSKHDPLPLGEWKIQGVARNPPFSYNPALFWDATPGHSKATIPPGPNNPVGLVWIDLSKEHYGIHGTPEPSTIAKTQSHGCIRLTNWDVLAMAAAVKPGMTALLQE